MLSRADEIGVGRLDALNSARRIARRYRADDKIRGLCQTVVAVAGLLAETGRTMRQHEFAALTTLAGLPRAELDGMLLSVDRFSRVEMDALDTDTRARLMERFGLFGVRLGATLIRQGVTDPTALSAELVRRSGLDDLRTRARHPVRRASGAAQGALGPAGDRPGADQGAAARPALRWPPRWSGSSRARTSSPSCGCWPRSAPGW